MDDRNLYSRLDFRSRPYGSSNRRGRRGMSYGRGYGGRRDKPRNNYSRQEEGSEHIVKRHPPGLRGREIGLWYARNSSGESSYKRAMAEPPKLAMDGEEAWAINEAIDGLSGSFDNHSGLVKVKLERIPQENPSTSWRFENEPKIKSEKNSFADPFESSDEEVDEKVMSENTDLQHRADIESVLNRIQDSDFKSAYKQNIEANKLRDTHGLLEMAKGAKTQLVKNPELDQSLYDELLEKDSNMKYREMLGVRKNLPSFEMREKILDIIRNNQVVVLSGETGCGKTTQVPQFVLDEWIGRKEGSTCRVICTQPRRISAISVAERVADERGESLGKSVGYQIRLEARLPRSQGSVLYCTTGIILQWLQSDPLLSSVSHLVLDEIHERDSLSDFLICIAKDIIPLRPDLKVILMSATLNAEQFFEYFNNCPMIHIPGFTYPVEEFYLEDVLKITSFSFPADKRKSYQPWKRFKDDNEEKEREEFIMPHIRQLESSSEYPRSVTSELYKKCSEELNLELVLSLLKNIARQPPGAVLVFMPGWEQISKLDKMIKDDMFFSSGKFLVIPLHSLMPTVNQKEVFNRPREGVRKIVIATNIAETSITIDDIVYVVDGGRIKMKNYDKETNISTLLPEWVTLANARQRRGRAGRVQKGICYHLYTKARELLLDPFPLPEIRRTRLEEVILQLKSLRLGSSKTFLRKVMDPPEEEVIDVSLKMLRVINALDDEENLTPLGFHLGRLPMDPLTGKMLLMGSIFSCLGPVLTVAASLSFKDPFIMVLGKEKLVDKCRVGHAKGTKSDHLMLVNVFDEWQQMAPRDKERFVWGNFLSSSILKQLKNMRLQFTDILKNHKFIDTRNPDAEEINRNSDNISLVKAIITAGLYPNVARITKKFGKKYNQGQIKGICLPDVKRAAIHPKSVNEKEKWFESSWLVYWEKIKTSKVYIYDTTMVSNYPLLLFGEKVEFDSKTNVMNVDGFVKVQCDKQVADVIKKLRKELDELLEYKISHPGVSDWSEGSKEGKLLSLIVDFLSSERESTNYDAPRNINYDDLYDDDY